MQLPDWPHPRDLEAVRTLLAPHLEGLRAARLFISGGTGIVGKWLLASLLHADTVDRLGLQITVLSRNPDAFRAQHPTLGNDPRVGWASGDIRSHLPAPGTAYTHVLHAATDVVAAASPSETIDTCVGGTLNALRILRATGASRMLLLSSGAVYGTTPDTQGAIPEDYVGPLEPLNPHSAYAQGKRTAELLCAAEAARGEVAISIARCFAMVGPYLPLDKHFAIGNFIEAALQGRPLHIKGDGTPVRSYLYLSDVAARLLLLLLAGPSGVAFNVGGSEPLSIAELARRVPTALGLELPIVTERAALHGAHAQRYYPDTTRLQQAFALPPELPLDVAIARTADWYRPVYSRSPHPSTP